MSAGTVDLLFVEKAILYKLLILCSLVISINSDFSVNSEVTQVTSKSGEK